VLTERGLWRANLTKAEAKAILAAEPDFMGQQRWLAETVTNSGSIIDFFPKIH